MRLARLLTPKVVAHAHCDLPCGVYDPAQARIEGETIVVHCDKVKKPAAVRYAFTNFPVTNLENGAGWPVVPFRTDTWPEKMPATQNK